MHFAVTGISYKDAPMEIREQVVFTDTGKMDMYGRLNEAGIEEAVILSTCNRSEVYFLYGEEEQTRQVKNLYSDFFRIPSLKEFLFEKKGEDALRYLFEVTNGLHSLVVGEDQILGQVVQAEEFSRQNGCSRKIMNHIFRDSITCAKKAKTKYRISEIPLSLSYIGIRQLHDACGISGKEILVLGSGKMSRLALRYLFDEKPAAVYNANRNRERAEGLKKEFPDLEVVGFPEIYQVMEHCDIVVGATSSPHVIVKRQKMPERKKELYMVDLASPRDIDPSLEKESQIHLYDMDYLGRIAEENNRARLEKAAGISDLIREEVKETMRWIASSRVDRTIQTLQEKVEEVSSDTYAVLERKLDLSEHDKAVLKKVLRSSMKRLMREPIVSLKQVDEDRQEKYHEVVKDLFHLED